MDSERFGERRTGELVRVELGGRPDWAFLPAPFPRDWELPLHLWQLLSDAKMELGRLDGIGHTLSSPTLLLHPLQNREALRSSSLEGTHSTPRDLYLFDVEPPAAPSERAAAWLEVSNYRNALREGHNALVADGTLSLTFLRQLHAWLLDGVRGRDKNPGAFRKTQVVVGSGNRYIPPPPTHLEGCLEDFNAFLSAPSPAADPLVQCFMLHYQIEAIHPFSDGNGRVGRLLLSLMIRLWCGLSLPWLYLSAYFERYKDEYIDRLFAVSAQGAWEGWIEFCLNGAVDQARDAVRRCDLLGRLKTDYAQRVEAENGRIHQLAAEVFERPLQTIPMVQRRFDITYPTAKRDVERLVELGILFELEREHPRRFTASDVLDISYGEAD